MTGANAARVEKLIFKRMFHSERHHFHNNKERKWLFVNVCELEPDFYRSGASKFIPRWYNYINMPKDNA
jgi:hypothetical protein